MARMATPLPPTVHGPITPLSKAARVSGVLAGASVRLLMDGNTIGDLPQAAQNGEVWVPISGTAPIPHRSIAAVQELGGVPSESSPFPIEVVEVPNPLPVPVLLSQLNTCMTDVWLDGLVPGATIRGQLDGAAFGTTQAAATNAMLSPPITQPIPTGATLEAWQEGTVSGTFLKSGSVVSLPIPAFVPPLGHRTPLPPPKLKEPLFACDTSRLVLEAIPGAVTILTQGPRWESFYNSSPTFSVYGGMPLDTGKLIVRQEMKRCGHDGTEATLTVQPLSTPPAPAVSHEICPNVLRLTISNLLPGGVLIVQHEWTSGSQTTSVEVGRAGISKSVESFDLPASLDLSDPWKDQWLVVTQSRCGFTSPASNRVKPSRPTRPPAPVVQQPVFACVRRIRVEGVRPGAHLHVADGQTGETLSDPYQATTSSIVMRLWFPAVEGRSLFVHQRGCGADWNTDPVPIKALPDPLPIPDIVEPVRPGAPTVRLKGVLPGAMVHLLVNWTPRTSVESLVHDPVVAVPAPALEERQSVFAVQTLCAKSSAREGRPAIVTRGHLQLTVTPTQMMRETPSTLRVEARDADTGDPVTAQVFLNGKPAGMTGQNISYTPTATEPNPAGIVRAMGYVDATFSIALSGAAWTLETVLGTGRADLGIIPLYVNGVTWTLTPAWNSALGKTVNVPGTQNYAPVTASTKLPGPFPSDSPKTVNVTITVAYSSPGGTYNGRVYEPMNHVIALTQAVAYDGVGKRIAFTFTAIYAETDPESGEYGAQLGFAGIVNV